VTHNQDVRETHAEQEKQTSKSEQGKERASSDLLLSVRTRCQHLGLADATIDTLVETYSLPELAQQLDWLPLRHPRDPAAMFISAMQGCWSAPAHHDPNLAREVWLSWTSDLAGETGTPEDPSRTEPVSYDLPDVEQDARSVWSSVLAELQTQMPRASFDTWLTDTRVLRVDAGSLIVGVRDEYTAEWLRTHWLSPIQRIVAAIVGRPLPVLFEVSA